jgi:hypothetical protein
MADPPSQRKLQFSTRGSNHAICYEVQPQMTPVWCVAASTKMLLDFYRYEYAQQRLAGKLGLGTTSNPTGLPNGMEGKVVDVIDAMTSNALDATVKSLDGKDRDLMWADVRDEIVANRPVISFIPGHARTIAGYLDAEAANSSVGTPGRYLLVYDPAMGGGNRWENVRTQVYRFAFKARLRLA